MNGAVVMKSQEPVRTRLGDILLEKGLITNDQLQYAINAQKVYQLPLGEILIANKWISQWKIKRALRTQSKLRNAILTSILSLSPLALVGCGSAGSTAPESTTSAEQVIDASQVDSDDSLSSGSTVGVGSNDGSSEEQPSTGGDPFVLIVDEADPVTEAEPVAVVEDPVVEDPIVEAGPVVETDPSAEEVPVVEEEAVAVLGDVDLSWSYPEERMDGSEFNVYEVKGFRIYQVSVEGEIDTIHDVDGLYTDFRIENLEQGEHFFAITVVDSDGLESDFSETISVSII